MKIIKSKVLAQDYNIIQYQCRLHSHCQYLILNLKEEIWGWGGGMCMHSLSGAGPYAPDRYCEGTHACIPGWLCSWLCPGQKVMSF